MQMAFKLKQQYFFSCLLSWLQAGNHKLKVQSCVFYLPHSGSITLTVAHTSSLYITYDVCKDILKSPLSILGLLWNLFCSAAFQWVIRCIYIPFTDFLIQGWTTFCTSAKIISEYFVWLFGWADGSAGQRVGLPLWSRQISLNNYWMDRHELPCLSP